MVAANTHMQWKRTQHQGLGIKHFRPADSLCLVRNTKSHGDMNTQMSKYVGRSKQRARQTANQREQARQTSQTTQPAIGAKCKL